MSAPAESSAKPLWDRPSRVWSLWDMLKINAESFYTAAVGIANVDIQLRNVRSELGEAYMARPVREQTQPHQALVDFATTFAMASTTIGADVSFTLSKRLIGNLVEDEDFTFNQFGECLRGLEAAFRAELSTRHFYLMEQRFIPYAEPKEPIFGAAVAAKFPALSEDIENAGMCLALGQPTACVFHLMRAMEGAVGELCAKLSIPNPDLTWGQLLSGLHTAIEKMPKGKDRNAWSEAHANLYHVKQAWRNETMHPKQTYTADQAEDVLRAMRTFMSHLVGLV